MEAFAVVLGFALLGGGLALLTNAARVQVWAIKHPPSRWTPFYTFHKRRVKTRAYLLELRLIASLCIALGAFLLWSLARY